MVATSDPESLNSKVLVGRGQISSGNTPSVAHPALNSCNSWGVSNPVVSLSPAIRSLSERKTKLLRPAVLMILNQNSPVSILEKWEHAVQACCSSSASGGIAKTRFVAEFDFSAIFPPHISCHFDAGSLVA